MDAAGVCPACSNSSALAYYAMPSASKRPCREQQVKAESRLRLHLQCSGCWHSTYPHLAVGSFSTWWRDGDANLRWLQSLTQPYGEVKKQSSRGDSSHPVRCKPLPSKRLPRGVRGKLHERLPRGCQGGLQKAQNRKSLSSPQCCDHIFQTWSCVPLRCMQHLCKRGPAKVLRLTRFNHDAPLY